MRAFFSSNMGARLLTCFLFFIVSGCGYFDVKTPMDSDSIFKRDFDLNVNGREGSGILVASYASEYRINMRSKGNLDLLTIETCHRYDEFEKASKKTEVTVRRFFRKKKKIKKDSQAFEYIFKPAKGLEDEACPMMIGGYDQKGRHSWGLIEFESPSWRLKASLDCNGSNGLMIGVSACQSKVGLIQKISFFESVKISPDVKCPLNRVSDRSFELIMPRGDCAFVFMGSSGDVHRLTTVGFDKIMMRKI